MRIGRPPPRLPVTTSLLFRSCLLLMAGHSSQGLQVLIIFSSTFGDTDNVIYLELFIVAAFAAAALTHVLVTTEDPTTSGGGHTFTGTGPAR